jgi:hypothetical protein
MVCRIANMDDYENEFWLGTRKENTNDAICKGR